jgi:hypothetical protein
MPNKNSKKARRAGQSQGTTTMTVRGYIVVSSATGRRIYLPSHPEGISEAEAKRLSDGLGVETKVVPFSQAID